MNLLTKKIACFVITVCIGITSLCYVEDILVSKNESLENFFTTESTVDDVVYGYGNKINQKKEKENEIELNNGNLNGKSWNQKMIQAGFDISSEQQVKVAIIDSGVNFSTDIEVAVRRNFIPNDDVNVLYEDPTGHGTAIAGIIAALDNEEGITGINPNVKVYSARVLDENLEAPVDRIVQAIKWAIEEEVDIINMSFGLQNNVAELEAVIEEAAEAGILMIAAVGNGKNIAYPAAYDEVIAVGAVAASGIPSENSATGDALELMAPGENLVASGIFGGLLNVSGTSFAVPHVVGVASVLMELNPEMSADYIRILLDYSANLYGAKEEYGNGVIDLEYAIQINEKFKKIYEKNIMKDEKNEKQKEKMKEMFWGEVLKTIPENEKAVECFTGVEVVEGMWGSGKTINGTTTNGHKQLIENGITQLEMGSQGNIDFTSEQMKIIIEASHLADSDSKLKDMDANPYHGFYLQRKEHDDVVSSASGESGPMSNYVANYVYLTKLAIAYGDDDTSNTVSMSGITGLNSDRIIADINDENIGSTTWANFFSSIGVENSKENKELALYGLALHSVTDVFAHSTWRQNSSGVWGRFGHNTNNFSLSCDNPNLIPNRYAAALEVAKKVLTKAYYGSEGLVTDFLFPERYVGDFYLKYLVINARNTDASTYSNFSNSFKKLDYDNHTYAN